MSTVLYGGGEAERGHSPLYASVLWLVCRGLDLCAVALRHDDDDDVCVCAVLLSPPVWLFR